jgi:hypothetical protein
VIVALQLTFQDRDDHLLIEGTGEWELGDVERKVEAVRQEAEERGYRRVLIDIRTVTPPPREIERFFVGERIAQVWGHSLKVAIVWRPEMLTMVGENAAVNRGANMKTFSDEDQAVHWLVQDARETEEARRATDSEELV